MAEFTNVELRAERESRKMPRWKLAGEIGVSEDTLERWETGKQLPDPDDIGNIERILGACGIWHKWMMSHYDSYRERHGEVPYSNHLTTVVVRAKHEMADVMQMFDDVERDALDGVIDDVALGARFKKEAREAIAAIQQALDRIPGDS